MKQISLKEHFIGLSKDSFIYGVGNAMLKILAVLTIPIFTRIFVPSDYGIINLITSITYFLSLLLIFGMDSALQISFFEYKKERKVIVSTVFWFLVVWGLLLSLICSLTAGWIAKIAFGRSNIFASCCTAGGIHFDGKILFIFAFLTAFFTLMISIAKTVFRLEFRAKIFAIVAIFQAVISSVVTIVLVLVMKEDLFGYFLGLLIGALLAFLMALIFLRKNLVFKVNTARLKEMVVFGSMMVPTSLSFYVFDLADRFFINKYWSLTELGLYSVAINVTGLISFFSVAIGQAWSPYVLKLFYEKKQIFNRFVPRVFIYYLVFFFVLSVLVTFFGRELLQVFTTSPYFGASRAIGPMALAMTFSASLQMTILGTSITRKTKYLALFSGLTAALNIGFNFLLIPKYGMVGAAWATAISYLFLTICYFITSQKFVYLQLDWQKISKLILLSIAAITLGPLTWHLSIRDNLMLKIFEALAYLGLLYLLGIIENHEIKAVKALLVQLKIFRLKKGSNDNR